MNSPTMRRLGLAVTFLVATLLLPTWLIAQNTPPTIPHSLEGRTECLVCHEAGIAGAPQYPPDHAGRSSDICQVCHQPGLVAETPVAASPTPSEPAGATPTSEPTASPTAMPDKTTGMPALTVTSTPTEEGTATATPTRQPSPTATNAPAATPEPAATPTPAEAAASAEPAPVPHTLEGRENCLECHSAEGGVSAGPPDIPHPLVGRDKCLACHAEGIGGAPKLPENHAGRTEDICQACHQPGQPAPEPTATRSLEPIPTPLVYPAAEGVNTCLACHATLPEKDAEITQRWQRSIHAERGVSCADCHGGNPAAETIDEAMSPAAGYIGAPAKKEIPALCASCHADVARMRQYNLPTDQYAKYRESVHGMRLDESDTNVATCFDCHGGHQILKANDPASTVYPSNVPALCASCHADKELMAPYGIPTNQYDLYRQSVHGHALLDAQDFRAPNCATCHGTHGAAPPGFQEVANVCGSCHTATQNHYLKGPHASAGDAGPKCVTCHGRYDVSDPSEALFIGSEARHCGSCHAPDTPGGQVAQSLYNSVTAAATAYEEAEAALVAARSVGMLVAPMESQLHEANTDLVTARAAQHTLDTTLISDKTNAAIDIAEAVKADAQAAIDASIFRRRAMVVAVIAIALVVVALYLLKLELDRKLEAGD